MGKNSTEQNAQVSDGRTQFWMTTPEAAKYCRMKPRTLAKLAREKKIHHGFTGRTYTFTTAQLDAYLLANGWAQ